MTTLRYKILSNLAIDLIPENSILFIMKVSIRFSKRPEVNFKGQINFS